MSAGRIANESNPPSYACWAMIENRRLSYTVPNGTEVEGLRLELV